MRFPRPRTEDAKGSQKWIQDLINTYPEILNAHIREKFPSLTGREIMWLSPVKSDEYAEYRDAAFLEKLGLEEIKKDLKNFWPKRGPQWDGFGKTKDGKAVILLEAKANVPELKSTCGAKSEKSLHTISESFRLTREWLDCSEPQIDWKCEYYRYANRLAHLYFFKEIVRKEAYLVFLYFINDPSHIRTFREQWDSALQLQKKLMGLSSANLSRKIIEIFVDCETIKTLATDY